MSHTNAVPWTEQELELIKELYPIHGKRAPIAGKLPDQIKSKAAQLGLRVNPGAAARNRKLARRGFNGS